MGGAADGRSCADPCCLNNGLANNLYLVPERSSHPGPLLSLFCFSNVLLAMGCRSDGIKYHFPLTLRKRIVSSPLLMDVQGICPDKSFSHSLSCTGLGFFPPRLAIE